MIVGENGFKIIIKKAAKSLIIPHLVQLFLHQAALSPELLHHLQLTLHELHLPHLLAQLLLQVVDLLAEVLHDGLLLQAMLLAHVTDLSLVALQLRVLLVVLLLQVGDDVDGVPLRGHHLALQGVVLQHQLLGIFP